MWNVRAVPWSQGQWSLQERHAPAWPFPDHSSWHQTLYLLKLSNFSLRWVIWTEVGFFCDKMHCSSEITDGLNLERLQLLCFKLQALATYDWMIYIILLLLPVHHYVFGFSFYCLVLQELLLLRIHGLVNLKNNLLHRCSKHSQVQTCPLGSWSSSSSIIFPSGPFLCRGIWASSSAWSRLLGGGITPPTLSTRPTLEGLKRSYYVIWAGA